MARKRVCLEPGCPNLQTQTRCPAHRRALIEHGADVNAVQSDEFTPLMGAAQNGQMEMIELLLAHGARADVARANGQTPVDLAREGGHAAAAELLKRHTGGEA